MIRGRKELRHGGSGKPKPLSLSQEMSVSDLRRAAVQGGLPGESDPFSERLCSALHQDGL